MTRSHQQRENTMTKTVRFPGDDFPAFPSIALEAPEDWEPIHAYGSVLAVAEPQRPGRFRSNVVVALSRFGADYALDTAVQAVTEKFQTLPDLEVIGREERTVLGAPGFRMEVSFSDPRVGTLVQAVHLAVIPAGGVSDLVQVTGTAGGAQAREDWPTIRAVLDSATTDSSTRSTTGPTTGSTTGSTTGEQR